MAEVTPGQAAPRLRMRGIAKRFGGTAALAGVDLAVAGGEIHALVGENGAGKSTLMKVLSGAERADSGSMELDNAPFRPRSPLDARRAGVAMIYQELSLAPHLAVEANISLGLEPHRAGVVRSAQARQRARTALDLLGHGGIDLLAPVRTLSIAQQQIVEIARALASGCRVLVLDEPTSSLSSGDVRRLFSVLRRLRGQGLAIVYISHFLEEVKQIADRFTVLRDGTVSGGGATAAHSAEDMVALMIGRRLEQLYPRSSRSPGETVLEAHGLSGAACRVREASLSVRRGEVLGIAGLVGAGRTELLRLLFGMEKGRQGTVTVAGDSGHAAPSERLGRGVGLLSEDRKGEGLAVRMSVADNVTLSRLSAFGPCGLVLPRRQTAAARHWVRRLGIRCQSVSQPAGGLSGGNQQKVALARLLHHGLDVLLLDEPTRGVDVASKAEIYRLIDALACGNVREGRPACAVLVVSSYLPELLGICDRIAVMARGVLHPARPAQAWTAHSLLAAAAGQEAAA